MIGIDFGREPSEVDFRLRADPRIQNPLVMVLPPSHPFLKFSDEKLLALVGPTVTVIISRPLPSYARH